MTVTQKLLRLKTKSTSLTWMIVIVILVLLLVAAGVLVYFNLKNSRLTLMELNTEQMTGYVSTFSGFLNGDSIEVDLQRKEGNRHHRRWNRMADSMLARSGLKDLYVANINYVDSIEYYLTARSNDSTSYFLAKESLENFNIDAIKKFKSGRKKNISFVSFIPNHGLLLSIYAPIKNSNDEIVAFVGAGREMNEIDRDIKKVGLQLLGIGFFVVIIAFLAAMFIMRKVFIYPIKRIIQAADNFNLQNKSFEELDLTYIKEYDALIGSFIRMERKINEAVRKSFTDDLTKLKNRHFFTIAMENILRPVNKEKKIAFFIIDVDFFKQVNDTYGHDKGDSILKSTGAILQQLFEDLPGVVARLGGDEFALCIDDVESAAVVEKKCKAIKEQFAKIKCSEDADGISASVGVAIATFSSNPPEYSEIFSAADATLYRVKAKGRNGYEISNLSDV